MSDNVNNFNVLIIGGGEVAREYIKALRSLNVQNIGLLTRSRSSADKIGHDSNIKKVFFGGEEKLPEIVQDYNACIIATPIEKLLPYLFLLSEHGIERILVEKPVALSSAELAEFISRYPKTNARVALNRIFYPSILEVKKRLPPSEITSAEFNFTEWVHRIDCEKFSKRELARWGISNCIHVIATVFHIIGSADKINGLSSGKGRIPWHPTGSVFVGAGVSRRGVPFSYGADWNSAGRWSITLRSMEGSYRLAPMEGLEFCPRGSLQYGSLVPVYSGDIKCGFAEMLGSWLFGRDDCADIVLKELLEHLCDIERIFDYGT